MSLREFIGDQVKGFAAPMRRQALAANAQVGNCGTPAAVRDRGVRTGPAHATIVIQNSVQRHTQALEVAVSQPGEHRVTVIADP